MSRLWSPHRTHDCTNGIDAERSVGCRLDNDSYLVTAVPLMFFMALALIVWLIIAKVLWERRIKAFSNAVR